MRRMVRIGDGGLQAVAADTITAIDATDLSPKLILRVQTKDGWFEAVGIHAVEAAMIVCPNVIEGSRYRWARNAWVFHNLVGHPLMQVLALFKFYDTAMWVHDSTVPKPRVQSIAEER